MIEVKLSDNIRTLPKAVQKYLMKFGNEKWTALVGDKNKRFENVVVIPALAEFENIKKLLQSLSATEDKYHEKFLILFVINQTVSAKKEISEDNNKSFELIKKLMENTLFANYTFEKLNFAVINAFEKEKALDDKTGGVGLARKIGLDFGLTLLDYKSPKQKSLISLDADCEVSKNYFTALYEGVNNRKIKAGHVRFEHPTNIEPYSDAIIKYEIFLRYYVYGLKYARSPFAFFTIGSTMFSDWEAYVKIGGMNKRKAAEDFYFMEKLGKLFDIVEVNDAVVYPSPRVSHRVPFGTGRSVGEMLSGKNKYDALYSPGIFEILKRWNEYFFDEKIRDAHKYLSFAKNINEYLYDFLMGREFEEYWTEILKSGGSQKQINRQKKFWFDGFRTLKFVHFMRDNCCENVALGDKSFTKFLRKDYWGKDKMNFYEKILEFLRRIT